MPFSESVKFCVAAMARRPPLPDEHELAKGSLLQLVRYDTRVGRNFGCVPF